MSEEQNVPETPQVPAEDLRSMRIKKAESLIQGGVNPYGHRVKGLTSCADVKALIAHIQKTVLEKDGVLLEPEVRIID